MLEKADYTCNYAVIRQTRQPTHLPVICIIPSFPTRRIIKKKGSGKHFHNVLCLSEAKGMDINMKRIVQICLIMTGIFLGVFNVYGSSTYQILKDQQIEFTDILVEGDSSGKK